MVLPLHPEMIYFEKVMISVFGEKITFRLKGGTIQDLESCSGNYLEFIKWISDLPPFNSEDSLVVIRGIL